MPQFVYTLNHPITDVVGYVGITDNLYERFMQHMTCRGSGRKLQSWLGELRQQGLIPTLKVVEILETRAEAQEREKYWIRFYLDQGVILYNLMLFENKPRKKASPVKRHEQQYRPRYWYLT